MTSHVWISIACPDRTGLIAEVAGCLFDHGANLGDTTFAVLGAGAEFTSVCEIPDGIALDQLHGALAALDVLRSADISVRPFTLQPVHEPSARISHVVVVSGADRPGLVARLCEAFAGFGANIVRLDCERMPEGRGDTYVARFAVNIPPASAANCLATVSNTAEGLQLTCKVEPA